MGDPKKSEVVWMEGDPTYAAPLDGTTKVYPRWVGVVYFHQSWKSPLLLGACHLYAG